MTGLPLIPAAHEFQGKMTANHPAAIRARAPNMSAISIHEAAEADFGDVSAFYAECGYKRGFNENDTVLVAVLDGSMVGVVRLCPENGVVVLRGMQIRSNYQRQGIGQDLLDQCLPHLGEGPCYCLPWSHLERFYNSIGFRRCRPSVAPEFLADRYSGYIKSDMDVILMRRFPRQ